MAFTEKTVSWVGLIEFGIPNEIIRKYSETAWKFGLYYFYWQKSSESWTLSFLLAEKAQKVELYHF